MHVEACLRDDIPSAPNRESHNSIEMLVRKKVYRIYDFAPLNARKEGSYVYKQLLNSHENSSGIKLFFYQNKTITKHSLIINRQNFVCSL